ncbi:MAG TPA: hypothetical protein PK785_07790, partial [Bacteroidales bacterium]|nr:hypothetical protein [Bacteroidales bacterium]
GGAMKIIISQPIKPYIEISNSERANPWLYLASEPDKDEYTEIDGVSKKLRELIVDVNDRTGANEWFVRKEEFMNEIFAYIDFIYEYQPQNFSIQERKRLLIDYRKHAVSAESLCNEFNGKGAKKCENCDEYTQLDKYSFVCGKHVEELSWAYKKLDTQEKLFKIQKSMEIEKITEEWRKKMPRKEKLVK